MVASTGSRICNTPWEPRTKLANSSTSRWYEIGKTLESERLDDGDGDDGDGDDDERETTSIE